MFQNEVAVNEEVIFPSIPVLSSTIFKKCPNGGPGMSLTTHTPPSPLPKKMHIPHSRPAIDESDIQSVAEVLRSGWLTTGPKVAEFERAFAAYIGSRFAVAVNSGTAALDLAVSSLQLQDGEIITTPFSFVATTNAIVFNRLQPVFVDIERETLNIDQKKVRAAITPRTKAILSVDYGGQPGNLEELQKIAEEHNLYFIEDAAHALGAEYGGKRIGTFADLTTFSFHPVKNITTGEGGMITTDNEELYQRLLLLRNHGLDKQDHHLGESWAYNQLFLGRNYRLTDFQCALGISQLSKIGELNKRRAEIAQQYKEGLNGLPEISFPAQVQGRKNSWHLFIVLAPDSTEGRYRNALFLELQHRGIQGNVHYIPIYRFDFYKQYGFRAGDFPVAEEMFRRVITLPLYPGLREEEVSSVITAIGDSLKNISAEVSAVDKHREHNLHSTG